MDEFEGHLRVVSRSATAGSGTGAASTLSSRRSRSTAWRASPPPARPSPRCRSRDAPERPVSTAPVVSCDHGAPDGPAHDRSLDPHRSGNRWAHRDAGPSPHGAARRSPVGFGNDNGTLAVSLRRDRHGEADDAFSRQRRLRVGLPGGGTRTVSTKAVRVLDQDGTIPPSRATAAGTVVRGHRRAASRSSTTRSRAEIAWPRASLRPAAPRDAAAESPPARHVGPQRLHVRHRRATTRRRRASSISNPAYRMVETPSHIASMTNDWWSGEPMLSLTPKANADDANPTGRSRSPSSRTRTRAPAATGTAAARTPRGTTRASLPTAAPSSSRSRSTATATTRATRRARGGGGHRHVEPERSPDRPAGRKSRFRASNGYWAYGGCGVGPRRYAHYSYFGGYNNLVGAGDLCTRMASSLISRVVTDLVDEKGNVWDKPESHLRPVEIPRAIRVFSTPSTSRIRQNLVAEAAINLPDSPAPRLHVMNGTVLHLRWWPRRPRRAGPLPSIARRLTGVTKALSSVNVPACLHVDAPSSRLVTTDHHVSRLQAADYQSATSAPVDGVSLTMTSRPARSSIATPQARGHRGHQGHAPSDLRAAAAEHRGASSSPTTAST